MPGKEAVVEAVVPEPVTKEVPKCDGAVESKGKTDEPVKTAETEPTDSAKPQDTEITSSEEKKTEEAKESAAETVKVDEPVESTNGSAAKLVETTEVSPAEDSSANGDAKQEDSLDKPVGDQKTSEAVPKAELEVKEAEAKPVEVKSSEAEAKPDETEVKSSEGAKPMETDENVVATTEPETMQDDAKTSEAAAKPLPADDEKMIVEKDTKSPTPDVTGSDEVKKSEAAKDGDETKDNGSSSVDSSTEKKSEAPSSSEKKPEDQPGSSSTAEPKPDVEAQIADLKKQGLTLYVQRDFCAAADSFGKVLELQAPLYGEMSEKLAETYFLYGSAMYEYGKAENTVLGEKVKEKDEEDDESEEMDVDEKPDPDSAEKEPSGSSKEPEDENQEVEETKEAEETKDADETIAGEEKEDDEDDAFRVAWEMLELAKATFLKAQNKKRLADTLMKLGEVGIETGNAEAIAEMVEALKVRKEIFPSNHRIIPETHFNIGVAFAFFEKYDDAIQHFTDAKSCLENRIGELSKSESKEDKDEIEEMKTILPEIQEKIQDTKESKADKEKIKEQGESSKEAPFPAQNETAKPVSDISHLVKRKRKVDDILPERAAKQSRTEEQAKTDDKPKTAKPEVESTNVEAKDSKTEVESSNSETEVSEAEVEVSKTDTEASKTEVVSSKTETEVSKTEVESGKTETEASKTEVESAKTETEARKTDDDKDAKPEQESPEATKDVTTDKPEDKPEKMEE